MAIPAFRDDGWLPEGHWRADWTELTSCFSGEPGSHREALMHKLLSWRDQLRSHGVHGRIILNGSFVSAKARPGDCDCLLVYDDSRGRVDEGESTRLLTDYWMLKGDGLGDVFVFPQSLAVKYPSLFVPDMFDYHKATRLPKGVIELDL